MKEPERQLIEQHPSLIHLFTSFLGLGTTAFGDPAMIAYIRKMAVDQKHWVDENILRVVLIETGISLIVL
jgi:chromate transport protein ChrA